MLFATWQRILISTNTDLIGRVWAQDIEKCFVFKKKIVYLVKWTFSSSERGFLLYKAQ